MAFRQEHVLRLDVAMHHSLPVRIAQGIRYFLGNRERGGKLQRPLTVQACAQRLAHDERHYVIEESVRLARVVERENVRVLEAGGHPDLLQEPLRPEDRGELLTQHFHRHLAVVPDVVGEVDGRHPTPADLTLDGIAASEGGVEAVELVGHIGRKVETCVGGAGGGRSGGQASDARVTCVISHPGPPSPDHRPPPAPAAGC